VFKTDCSEDLCEKVKMSRTQMKGKYIHHVISESICEIFSSVISNMVVREVNFGECLHEKMMIRINEKVADFVLCDSISQ
jgi:hypothetical protein